MRLTGRSMQAALLIYALLAALILGGVTWGTYATLQLEHERSAARANAEHDSRVTLALSRIDRILMRVIYREAAREYWEYNACAIPARWQFQPNIDAEETVVPSPLYDEKLLPWMKLHFQVSPNNIWLSPQVPEDCPWMPAVFPGVERRLLAERQEILHQLRGDCISYDSLSGQVAEALQLAREYECLATGTISPQPSPGASTAPGEAQAPEVCLDQGGEWTLAQRTQLPNEVCEPASSALHNFGQATGDMDEEYEVGISQSIMTPVWLDCVGHRLHRLAFVRSADMNGVKYYQGILVDWPQLKRELLDEIQDLLPDADLAAVAHGQAIERTRPIALPNAALVSNPLVAATLPWTSTHLLLIIAWAAALAILGSVGLGIHGLLSLTERRTQFAYAVTHELRTPLTTLRLYTDMLASGMVKPVDHDSYFRTLSAEAERLADMVNGVLEYSRIENRAVKLNLQSVTVSELLESIRRNCERHCESAGKKLVVEVNGLGPDTLSTDPQLVRQLIANLIDNACKYTRDADDPRITIRASGCHGDKIALDVEDRGPGIPVADRAMVFLPFRRGKNSATTSTGGIGLGLALARSWSHLLHGHLELAADHRAESGTCFRLTVPRSLKN